MPDSQANSKARKGTVPLNGALLKSFLESPHDCHAGYEAGRSTAGLPVVLSAVVLFGSTVREGMVHKSFFFRFSA